VAVVAIGAAVALIIPGAAVWQGDGWSWRIPAERFTKSNSEWRRAEAESYCKHWDRSKPRDLFSCQNYRGADRDIIVWGDSHAIHLIAGLSEAYPAFNIYALHRLDCISQSGFAGYVRSLADKDRTAECIDFNARALRFLAGHKPANVILTNAKRDNPAQIAPPTEYLLRELRAEGHHAFVLGDFIRPAVDINACRNVPDWAARANQSGDLIEITRIMHWICRSGENNFKSRRLAERDLRLSIGYRYRQIRRAALPWSRAGPTTIHWGSNIHDRSPAGSDQGSGRLGRAGNRQGNQLVLLARR
jgi:hypothetical protein